MNLDKQILKEIGQIATHHPEIQKILLFGSRARGDNSERSDIVPAKPPEETPSSGEREGRKDGYSGRGFHVSSTMARGTTTSASSCQRRITGSKGMLLASEN